LLAGADNRAESITDSLRVAFFIPASIEGQALHPSAHRSLNQLVCWRPIQAEAYQLLQTRTDFLAHPFHV